MVRVKGGEVGPELRAEMVARLRALADEVEAGMDPWCYAHDGDEGARILMTASEAARYAQPELDEDEWPEFVEINEWGLMLTMRRATIVAEGKSRSSNFDRMMEVELLPPDAHTVVRVLDWDCSRCGWEGPLRPADECPGCVVREAEAHGALVDGRDE